MGLNIILVFQNAGADTEGALRRFNGNPGLYERFLIKFLFNPTFQDMTNAFEAEDTQAALISTHTLKGLTANLGFTRLYGIPSKVMDCIRGNEFVEASGKYGEPKKVYDEIYEILSKV